jgi:phage tail-like protein
MQDVNGSAFHLLAASPDWTLAPGMAWSGTSCTLAGKQSWRLPPAMPPAAALAARAAMQPVVVDAYGAVARIAADGSTIESLDGANWVPVTDLGGAKLAPKAGRFAAMALGGARLALLATDGTNAVLQLFDLRQRWPLDTPENPSLPITLDPAAKAPCLAVAPDGPIFVLVKEGLAIFEGGPILEFAAMPSAQFMPAAANPNPLRRTALLATRPGGAAIGMAVDSARLAILCDQGSEPQTLALLDRLSGAWTSAPITATDATPLPYMTDIAFLPDGLIALLAPSATPASPADCAVVTAVPSQGVTLAASRFPMLNQAAPRFAAIPGPEVYYLGTAGPRRLVPLPYPAYLTSGALARFSIQGNDPDRVWHRLYAEAAMPGGTALRVWARAADQPVAPADQAAVAATILLAPPGTPRIDGVAAAAIAAANPAALPAPTATMVAALTLAPFHLQPPPVPVPLASELPFHPGLGGSLFTLLLQRTNGANRRLTGLALDLVAVATGDGRHSPCLHAIRIYTPRFCYQDQYLPRLFHQTTLSDETDDAPAAAPPDFRERLLANLEGILTPIETRAANAEYLLDPYAAPPAMLPWLGSYLGLTLDPGWPEARLRRALACAGKQLRERGTYRGVCLALDIATDGAVARGEIVLLETHRLRRTNATILGIPLSGLNVLTDDGVASGNSIVGDTLVLSPERAIDLLALLSPQTAPAADAATVSRFLDEYASRVQVAAILQSPAAAALRPAVQAVLLAELPAHIGFEIVLAENRFVLGLSPLLDIDTFLGAPPVPAPLTLDASVIGRDAVVRDPAALRQ